MYVNPANLIIYNWIQRYNVQAADLTGWQTAITTLQQGMYEGLVGASVLEGFAITLTSGMGLQAGTGIACGPSGYLDVCTTVTTETIAVPATGTVRSLVVVQPNVVIGTTIQDPVVPTQTDIFTTVQQAVVSVIAGVASNSPVYPAVPAGATVLCGVRSTAGQSTLATADLDFTVQDTVGKNSRFDHFVGLNDDRLRPYWSSTQVLGVKSSQIESPLPKMFTYVMAGTPSLFPKASGAHATGDTFLNFQTGAITGADTTSAAFTPTIPTAGNAIVATVGLLTNDTLAVQYGTIGTRAQCYAAIVNQTTAGAGAVSLPNAKLIVFVMLTSADGTNVTEQDHIDARSYSAFVATTLYPGYDIIVGGAAIVGATHATLAAALADGTQGTNKRVLLADSQTLANSAVAIAKAGWHIDAMPGVTYTGGGSSSALSCQATDVRIRGLRFLTFTSAITFTSAGTYCRVKDCNFKSCTTGVDTSSALGGNTFPIEEGTINE